MFCKHTYVYVCAQNFFIFVLYAHRSRPIDRDEGKNILLSAFSLLFKDAFFNIISFYSIESL